MIVKWLIFLTTMGAMHSFTSLLTVYCYVKSDIGKEYAMGTIFIGNILHLYQEYSIFVY